MALIVYISHPIRGDVPGNRARVRDIMMSSHTSLVTPFAPYLSMDYLDPDNPIDRAKSQASCAAFFREHSFHELWLYGDHLSEGMFRDIWLADEYQIPYKGISEEAQQACHLFTKGVAYASS